MAEIKKSREVGIDPNLYKEWQARYDSAAAAFGRIGLSEHCILTEGELATFLEQFSEDAIIALEVARRVFATQPGLAVSDAIYQLVDLYDSLVVKNSRSNLSNQSALEYLLTLTDMKVISGSTKQPFEISSNQPLYLKLTTSDNDHVINVSKSLSSQHEKVRVLGNNSVELQVFEGKNFRILHESTLEFNPEDRLYKTVSLPLNRIPLNTPETTTSTEAYPSVRITFATSKRKSTTQRSLSARDLATLQLLTSLLNPSCTEFQLTASQPVTGSFVISSDNQKQQPPSIHKNHSIRTGSTQRTTRIAGNFVVMVTVLCHLYVISSILFLFYRLDLANLVVSVMIFVKISSRGKVLLLLTWLGNFYVNILLCFGLGYDLFWLILGYESPFRVNGNGADDRDPGDVFVISLVFISVGTKIGLLSLMALKKLEF